MGALAGRGVNCSVTMLCDIPIDVQPCLWTLVLQLQTQRLLFISTIMSPERVIGGNACVHTAGLACHNPTSIHLIPPALPYPGACTVDAGRVRTRRAAAKAPGGGKWWRWMHNLYAAHYFIRQYFFTKTPAHTCAHFTGTVRCR